MRLAFWPGGRDHARNVLADAARPVQHAANGHEVASTVAGAGDIDLRLLAQAIWRRRRSILLPALMAFALSVVAVNLLTPRYKSEARILIDGRENVFLRPSGERNEERATLDPEAVTSQVQLVLSRDLAREIVRQNKLADLPEFDPALKGISPLKSLLALIGIGRDPFAMTPEERVLDAYSERLTAYAVDKSRVIVVEFQSRDPELAARIANAIANEYLILQQSARRQQATSASQWLSGEIDNLRRKVAEDEARVEDFRSKSSLFVGTNNTTLSNQQLGELNSQLNNARAMRSDAEARARLIRDLLQRGGPIEASEVLKSELIRRLSEQRVTLRAQLAEQSSTLLDNHPRIKELKAQLNDLDQQIRDEAAKIARALENDARIASGRVDSLNAGLDQLKKQASSSNDQDVQLRALEREAKAQRDLLESYLARYREATTRETIDAAPADGRIISRAIVSNTPAYPKKLPIVLIATLATLLLSCGLVVTGELLHVGVPDASESGTAMSTAGMNGPASGDPAAGAAVNADLGPRLAVVETPPGLRTTGESAESLNEVDDLAARLRAAGAAARKITVLGTSGASGATLALQLARALARDARVLLLDLEASSPTLHTIALDQAAPGLAELMQDKASFSEIITRDRLSRLHLVLPGRPGFDRSLLQSTNMRHAIDALLRVYDHVVLHAGLASELPAELLAAAAWAVVIPDPSTADDARRLMAHQLRAVGFAEVTILGSAAQRPTELEQAVEAA